MLRTLGALELVDAEGKQVLGAAAQHKPLLILALVGLTPGGIPRERLINALWPGVPRKYSQARLKQHLYALRRATDDPKVVAGTPKLSLSSAVQVDALELARHLEQGRFKEARALVSGELLEGVEAESGEAFATIIRGIRQQFAPHLALLRAAEAAEAATEALPPLTRASAALNLAERELRAAVNRFRQGVLSLPQEASEAYHRVAACNHDLMEALRSAANSGMTEDRLMDAAADARALWSRSELVQRLQRAAPGWPCDVETTEWLLSGTVRTADPVGMILERYLLGSGLAAQFRFRMQWQTAQVLRVLLERRAPRLLVLAQSGGRDLAQFEPLLLRSEARVVICDPDRTGLELARLRLQGLGERLCTVSGDCFEEIPKLKSDAGFDLILCGPLLDHLATRPAAWLVSRLGGALQPGGTLCLSNLKQNHAWSEWLRVIANVAVNERNRLDLMLLVGDRAEPSTLAWDRDPGDIVWCLAIQAPPSG